MRNETPAAGEERVIRRSQGGLCLWHGLSAGNFCRMLKQRPAIDAAYWARLASIGSLSLSNSSLNALESLLFGAKVAATPLPENPIFILGHWRSGTTLLHNLMTLDPRYSFPNLYQCMFPGHFLLTEPVLAPLTDRFVPNKRPMDDMPSGWKLPQEDEVALVLLTLLSPYIQVLHPSDRSKYEAFYALRDVPIEQQQRWKQAFVTFVKKLVLKTGKPPILKSPTHTFRVPLLREMFPAAKFVYIHRHPYDVLSSTMHLRRTMYEENGLTNTKQEDVFGEVLLTYRRLFETYERDKALIAPENLCTVRFEQLEQDPVGQIRKIYDSLGLELPETMQNQLLLRLPALRGHRKNKFELDQDVKQTIFNELSAVFDAYEYDSGLEQQRHRRTA